MEDPIELPPVLKTNETRSWRWIEDFSLLCAVLSEQERTGTYNGIRWSVVADRVGNDRNKNQCYNRYKYSLCKQRGERFTSIEDKKLLKLVTQLGEKWTEIGRILGNRNPNCVKHRYRILERKINGKPKPINHWQQWSMKDDQRLLVLMHRYKEDKRAIHQIKKKFTSRTCVAIRARMNRWKAVFEKWPEKYREWLHKYEDCVLEDDDDEECEEDPFIKQEPTEEEVDAYILGEVDTPPEGYDPTPAYSPEDLVMIFDDCFFEDNQNTPEDYELIDFNEFIFTL